MLTFSRPYALRSFGVCNKFIDFDYVAYLRSKIGLRLEFSTSAVVIRFWTIRLRFTVDIDVYLTDVVTDNQVIK